jgi:hypothetical protein
LETRARQSHAGPAAGPAQASGRRKKMKRTHRYWGVMHFL